MKFFKTLLYIIFTLLAMLSLLVLLCALNPEWSTYISNFLYRNNQEQLVMEMEGDEQEPLDIVNNGVVSTFQDGEGYIAPNESEIKEPENVAGKSGYRPIEETTEVIEEKDGEDILQSLGTGETGEGLDFDSSVYPYYAMLNPELQKLYRQIYANAMALNDHFAPIIEVSLDQMKNVFTAVVCDHPELFWLDTAYRSRYLKSGKCIDVQLQLNQTADNLTENRELFEERANQIVNQAQGLASDYEKEVYVHDTLIDMVEYNLNAPLNQNAYSALVNGQTVCAGYARAYQYLMQQLGIPCYYCMGFAGENHAWNIVSLDGEYYNVDATWNDTTPNTYDFFNKTDNDFSTNHVRKDLSIYLPPCNGETYREITVPMEGSIEDNRRSLEEAGFTTEEVLYSLEDYYNNCYDQIMENGLGAYSFQNVIQGEEVFQKMYDDYLNKTYTYPDQVIADLGGNQIEVEWEMEELKDGYMALYHNVNAK